MSLKVDFGKRIKKLRESLFMSQEAFAEKIGVHRNTLARIENGTNYVSLSTLEKIQAVLGVEYKELFNFSERAENELLKILCAKLKLLSETDIKYFLASLDAYLQTKNKNKN